MIRVRFAPSPTGYLHVGGARTALFDWLFARKNEGKFVLRIEDTDTQRSTKESENSIVKALRWCGIDWDEGPDIGGPYGPYRQSERVKMGIYDKYASELVKRQRAYCAIYDLEDKKKVIAKTFSVQEANSYKEKGHAVTLNFVVKSGETSFEDLAKGKMVFDNSNFDDMIIVKSNGYPTYNFAVVVDDHLMEITHVVRGEDHLTNTPKQIMIYQALGWETPKFMHIPLILGADRTPLSKRHGGTSVDYFREYGIMSVAFANYLSLLGWGIEDEIFNPYERVKEFKLEKLSCKPVIFDYSKLEWINGQHMRRMKIDEFIDEFKKWIEEYRREKLELFFADNKYTEKVANICRQKVNTFKVLLEFMEPFFLKYPVIEDVAKESLRYRDATFYLEEVLKALCESEKWDVQSIESALRDVASREDVSKKRFFQIVRAALLGKRVTPGLFESIEVLGRERTLFRLEKTLETLKKGV